MSALTLPDSNAAPTDHIPRLRRRAETGETRFLIQFGGQGNSFLPELRRLYAEDQEVLAPFFEMCFDVLRDVQARDLVRDREVRKRCYPFGFELRDWLRGRDAPPPETLFECPISFPGTTILQLALLYRIARSGYPLEALGCSTIAATGHSQGVLAAAVFALAAGDGGTSDPLANYLRICYDWLVWFSVAGVYIKREYQPPPIPTNDLEFSLAADERAPSPMAVVFGARTEELQAWIDAWAAQKPGSGETSRSDAKAGVAIALVNSPTVNVLAGHPVDLCRFRRLYLREFTRFDYDWEYLAVSAPFHSGPHLREISRTFARDPAYTSLRYHSRDIRVPLVSFVDGKDMRGGSSLVDDLTEILFHGRLDWYQTLHSIYKNFVSPPASIHVLDFGPGRTSATLTRKFLEREAADDGSPGNIISLNRPGGMGSFLR
ncbi:MAG: hypothetical protein RIF32_19895 [Leptospirales bacterium]|jgi:malonyl CoA-acyl carrier protein transacylase